MRYFIVFVFGLFLFLGCGKTQDRIEKTDTVFVDDLNNKIKIEKPPLKIITLAPSLTEMVYLLECGDKLVGNTSYCDYPEAANHVTKVGDLLNIDIEKIIMLKPDLVFISVEGNTKESYNKLKELGIKVFVSNPRSYEGIKKTIRDMGAIFNKKELAQNRIADWDKRIAKIQSKSGMDSTKKVMFVIEIKPLIVAGKNTFLNEYIEICGMKNVVADSKVNYPILNREEVLKRNPDFILYASNKKDIKQTILDLYPEWKDINAIKNNGIFLIDASIYFRPGPRFIEAVEEVSTNLHREENYPRPMQ